MLTQITATAFSELNNLPGVTRNTTFDPGQRGMKVTLTYCGFFIGRRHVQYARKGSNKILSETHYGDRAKYDEVHSWEPLSTK